MFIQQSVVEDAGIYSLLVVGVTIRADLTQFTDALLSIDRYNA